MDKKRKILFLIVTCLFILINVIFTTSIFTNKEKFSAKTGDFRYKFNISNTGEGKTFMWDISISTKDTKNGIIENKMNSNYLDDFRKAINEIGNKKVLLFYAISYLLFIILVLIIFWSEKKIAGIEFLKGLITATVIFVRIDYKQFK